MALAYTAALLAAGGVFVAVVIDHYLQPHIPPLDSLDWGTHD